MLACNYIQGLNRDPLCIWAPLIYGKGPNSSCENALHVLNLQAAFLHSSANAGMWDTNTGAVHWWIKSKCKPQSGHICKFSHFPPPFVHFNALYVPCKSLWGFFLMHRNTCQSVSVQGPECKLFQCAFVPVCATLAGYLDWGSHLFSKGHLIKNGRHQLKSNHPPKTTLSDLAFVVLAVCFFYSTDLFRKPAR